MGGAVSTRPAQGLASVSWRVIASAAAWLVRCRPAVRYTRVARLRRVRE